MSEPLHGTQYPKGLTEEEVRKIAREEAFRVLTIIKDQVANTPSRADGNLNARDFYQSLEFAEAQFRSSI